EELQPEIERAIKASRASVVVLSENYATSSWCLDELLLILQQKELGHFVLPVFYHVDPSDIRKQQGSFDIKVKPYSKWTDEKVCLWKTALKEVANLSGFTLSGPETNILKEIVDTIYNKLDRKEVHLPLNITGMATRYKEINSWLAEPNLEFLAIYGMGGSGKTTFAKHIFNSNWRNFEYVSFVENIGTTCKEPNDLLHLQRQLLKDISGGKKRKIPGVSKGTCMIGEAMQMNKTLIVLDDIVERSQLVALLGSGKINEQSKIIITTRENTANWFDLSCWRCQQYEMRLLNPDESLELLSLHAFGSKIPNEGYMQLLSVATRLCEGNPLALEVLGSSLSENDTPYWESLLNLFGKDIDSKIQGVLRRSYMSLSCDTVKELFLHVACFFVGVDMDYVVKILESYSATSGIKTLIKRCLLSVSPNKKLMMHRLLQEMAKNIVHQESKLPAKRSRVWRNIDSYKILSQGKGSKTVEGLALDMNMLRNEDFQFRSKEDIYSIAEMSKSSVADKPVAFTSSLLEEEMKSGTESDETMESLPSTQEIYDKQELYDKSGLETAGDFISTFDEIMIEESDPYSHKLKESVGMSKAFGSDEIKESDSDSHPREERKSVVKNEPSGGQELMKQKESVGMSKAFGSDEIKESDSPPHAERLKSMVKNEPSGGQKLKKIVLAVNLSSQSKRRKMVKELSALQGIESVDFDKEGKLIVIGDVDRETVIKCASMIADTEIISFGPASERQHEPEVKPEAESEKDDKTDKGPSKNKKSACSV
ncbi:hypothetical protein M8C21_033557, partial [Ambrosia artemisiifolia]